MKVTRDQFLDVEEYYFVRYLVKDFIEKDLYEFKSDEDIEIATRLLNKLEWWRR